MGILDWLFGGNYDPDIIDNAEADYQRKRGPGWNWDHGRAEASARARADSLQGKRNKGEKVIVTRHSHGTRRP